MANCEPEWGDILATTDERGKFVFSGVGSGVYSIVIDREKEFEPVSQEVQIVRERSTVPETYFVDKDGILQYVRVGPFTSIDQIREQIDPLLK